MRAVSGLQGPGTGPSPPGGSLLPPAAHTKPTPKLRHCPKAAPGPPRLPLHRIKARACPAAGPGLGHSPSRPSGNLRKKGCFVLARGWNRWSSCQAFPPVTHNLWRHISADDMGLWRPWARSCDPCWLNISPQAGSGTECCPRARLLCAGHGKLWGSAPSSPTYRCLVRLLPRFCSFARLTGNSIRARGRGCTSPPGVSTQDFLQVTYYK